MANILSKLLFNSNFHTVVEL